MWWERIGTTVQHEFSDLGNLEAFTIVVLRLLVSVVLGAMMGYERESAGATAGLRTHMLVALGSALFVLIPAQAGMRPEDLSRVIQGVAAGIGFLGAGAIIKHADANDIKGQTTAAGIWLTAAVGVAAGMGKELTAVVSSVFAVVILALVRLLSSRRDGSEQGSRKPGR
jgi:putative Mg2+ transporter-C (MgtC) family protein